MPNKRRLIYEYVDKYDALARQAVGMTGNKEDAQDVMQDVALSLLDRPPEADAITTPIAYIRTSVKNTALDYYRANKKRAIPMEPELLYQAGRDDSAYQENLVEMMDWINRQLASFSKNDRLAFVMHYIEGYPIVDLAHGMNIPYESLKKNLARMRKKAATALTPSIMLILLMPVMLSSFGDFGGRRDSEWGKYYAFLREHPVLLDDAYVITGSEIDKILDSGFPTVKELIEQAKAKFDLPDEAWEEFDAAIAEQALRANSIEHTGRRTISLGTRIAQHRKLVVACVIILILTGFFTLVPTGRALAAQFYSFVVSVIEDRIRVDSNPSSNQSEEYGTAIIVAEDTTQPSEITPETSYSSIEEFVSKTGLTPVKIQADNVKCERISLISNRRTGKSLTTQYTVDGEYPVALTQRWDADLDITSQIKDVSYEQRKILGVITLYYAVDANDKSFNGIAVIDNSLLLIEADAGVNIDQLVISLTK